MKDTPVLFDYWFDGLLDACELLSGGYEKEKDKPTHALVNLAGHVLSCYDKLVEHLPDERSVMKEQMSKRVHDRAVRLRKHA